MSDSSYQMLVGTPGNEKPQKAINDNTLTEWLDYSFKESGGPGYSSVLFNTLRGVRMLGPGNQQVPIPDDCIGLAFISRPMLNLSDSNVIKNPQLHALYNPERGSIQAYIKGLLDPVWGDANDSSHSLLDPLNPWMSLLTNLLKVSSGFPDLQMNVDKSDPGFRKQVYQYVSGIVKVNYDYDMSLSFHAMKPNIIPAIFNYWLHYIEGVTLGDEGMEPYPDALLQNYIDFDCRIYHIILNSNFKNIEGLYMSVQSIPHTFPSGAYSTIDNTGDTLHGQGQDEFSINMSTVGFRFDNVRIADQFNRTTVGRNPRMHPEVRANYYRKLEVNEYFEGAYGAYAWININEMTLEYWGKI